MPTACAAMPMRPPSIACMAILNPWPSVAEAVRRGHPAPLEHELGRVRGAKPELVLDLRDEKPGRALLDQERRDAAVRTLGIGLGEDQGHRRLPAVRHEHLAPIEHVVVAVAPGRASSGSVASEPAWGSVRAKQPSPRPEARGARKRSCCSGVPNLSRGSQTRELFTDITTAWEAQATATSSRASDVGERAGPAAAVLLGDHDPQQAQLAHSLHGGVGEARFPVALGRDGLDLLLGELPSEGLDHLLLVGQLEPHVSLGVRPCL